MLKTLKLPGLCPLDPTFVMGGGHLIVISLFLQRLFCSPIGILPKSVFLLKWVFSQALKLTSNYHVILHNLIFSQEAYKPDCQRNKKKTNKQTNKQMTCSCGMEGGRAKVGNFLQILWFFPPSEMYSPFPAKYKQTETKKQTKKYINDATVHELSFDCGIDSSDMLITEFKVYDILRHFISSRAYRVKKKTM